MQGGLIHHIVQFDDHESPLTRLQQLAKLLQLRAGHPAPELAGHRATDTAGDDARKQRRDDLTR